MTWSIGLHLRSGCIGQSANAMLTRASDGLP